MEREVCISLEFAVSNSIPVGGSGCGTGGGQRFLYPWDLEETMGLWAVVGAAAMLGRMKWTAYNGWIEWM